MEERLFNVRQCSVVEHAGVVDQGVDRAKGRHRLGDHGFDICCPGQVAPNGDRPSTRRSNLGCNALGALLIASVTDRDVCAGLAKRRRDARTDPL